MRFIVGVLLFTSALAHGALVNRGDRTKLYAARKKKLARQSGEPIVFKGEQPEGRRNLRALKKKDKKEKKAKGADTKAKEEKKVKKEKKAKKEKKGKKGKKGKETTVDMDRTRGVTLSDNEVEYGTPVEATFEVKTDEISLDALQAIDVATADWRVCLYMRMQNNNDPIQCVEANVEDEVTVDETTGIPDLDMIVDVVFGDTSAGDLPEITYGRGFDVYFQDGDGESRNDG